MELIVSGKRNGRPTSFRQVSPGGALEKARKLQSEGLDEVHITDITGRAYGPREFAACFVRSGG